MVPGNARMRCTLAAQAKASGLSRISRGHSSTYSTHVGVVVLGGESVDAHKYGLVTAISDLNLSNDNILAGGADHGSAGSIYVNDAPTGSRIGITEEPGLKLPTASFDEIKYGTEHTVSGGCHVYTSDPTAGCQISWHKPRGTHTLSPFTSLASTFVIVDAVPALHFDDWRQNKKNPLPDIALLLYAQGDDVSLNSVLKMEKLLPNSMSRLFLEVKSEMSISIAASEMVRSKAAAIAADVGLHVPVHLITTGPISFNASAVRDLVEQCVRVAMDVDERGVPLPYRGRRRSVVLDNLIKGIGVSVLLSLSTYAYLRYPGGLMGLCGALSREFINPAFLQVGVIFRNCIAATRRSTILLVQMCRDGLSGLLPSRPSQQLR